MIRRGEAKDYADIARLSCLCRERVSQIVRLNYLAPDIQVELLYLPPTPTGRYPIAETVVRKIANLLSGRPAPRMGGAQAASRPRSELLPGREMIRCYQR